MEIIKNRTIREKYHQGFNRTKDISEIIIHGTGGGSSSKGLMRWMLNGGRAREYRRGVALFHYIIDFDGKVIEIIDTDRWVYHSSSGIHDEVTIGIELMNPDFANNAAFTNEQYNSLHSLIFDVLLYKYPTIDTIMSHNRAKQKYSGGTKQCPGPEFSWDRLEDEMEFRNLSYEHHLKYESYWNIQQK